MATRAEYFARWSALHGDYDPASSRVVGTWLAVVHTVARPFAAARTPPWVLTLLGLVLVAAALPPAAAGGGWALVAAALVAVSGLLDSLDGAVAVMSGRTSALGYVLDSVVDRCADLLCVAALWAAGAPAAPCVVAGALTVLQEYLRARAGLAGMTDVGVVTVWERPTRVAVTVVCLLGAAVDGRAATAGAWAWVALASVGFVQLVVTVVRRLRRAPSPG